MLDLIELTNREVLLMMVSAMSIGVIAGVVFMVPTITKLESELRNIIEGK